MYKIVKMEEQINNLFANYGYKAVYDCIMTRFKADYEFLSELFQVKTESKIKHPVKKRVKNITVENPTTSTIGVTTIETNTIVPDTPKPVVEQRSEKKPVIKKIITKPPTHDIIVNKTDADEEEEKEEEKKEEKKESEDSNQETVNENAENESEDDVSIHVKNPSKCKDPNKQKLINEIKAKAEELKSKNIVPSSLLTKESMEKWIVDEGKTQSDICRETGCYSQVVRDRVKELGLGTMPKKQQFAIARKYGRI